MNKSQIKRIKVGSLLKCHDDADLDDMLEGKQRGESFDLCVVTDICQLKDFHGEKYYLVEWISSRLGGSGMLSSDHFSKDGLYELVK